MIHGGRVREYIQKEREIYTVQCEVIMAIVVVMSTYILIHPGRERGPGWKVPVEWEYRGRW